MVDMMRKDLIKLGSKTAKSGFKNEDDIVRKFNDWKIDNDAIQWLEIMGYDLNNIERILAAKVHGQKTDVQVQITIFMKKIISVENISVKLVSNPRGYNQVDKRWIDAYKEMWDIPEDIAKLLKLYTGEIVSNKQHLRDRRRMFFDEMTANEQDKILSFFKKNKILIVSDILKGRGNLSAGWMLVILKSRKNARWTLKNINEAMNVFGTGEVLITERGSLKIGKITMQRKGGDGGRKTANMLQFKINPAEFFENK